MELDSEEDRIYDYVKDGIDIERIKCGTPASFDLQSTYKEFQDKYFGSKVPTLTNDFICVFQKLPYDVIAITILEEKAKQLSVTKGIRINEKLRELPSEVKVALFHEMIHATRVIGHEAGFKMALIELWNKCAYLDPLII